MTTTKIKIGCHVENYGKIICQTVEKILVSVFKMAITMIKRNDTVS